MERLASLSLSPSPSSSSPGHVELLKEISEEQKFEVTYVDIEEVSKSGRMQCLVPKIDMPVEQLYTCTFQVQLSTLPVAVCFGDGGNHIQPLIFLALSSSSRLFYTLHHQVKLLKKLKNLLQPMLLNTSR